MFTLRYGIKDAAPREKNFTSGGVRGRVGVYGWRAERPRGSWEEARMGEGWISESRACFMGRARGKWIFEEQLKMFPVDLG